MSSDLDRLMAETARQAWVERARNLLIGLLFLALAAATYRSTEFSFGDLITKSPNMLRILSGFTHPDFSLVQPTPASPFYEFGPLNLHVGLIPHFVLETLAEAVLGTTLGAVVAIPLSFVAAGNLMRRNPLGTVIYFLVRTLMSVIRAVPTLFWGILFVTSIGLGAFPGVLAISLFSLGLMSKLFSEAIEAIDWGQVEALTATGANPVQVLVHGVGPQVLPYMIAHLLYTFEVNVHSATIVGIVGGGGVGFLFLQYIEQFQYPQEAMVIIVVVLMTMAIDYSSATIRRRII
ncbi:MAG TPA: phosphonate ABC transporter, permease protein PhnE [Candidatus Dormibacteraeota bacterium]